MYEFAANVLIYIFLLEHYMHESTVQYIQSNEIKCCKQHAMVATQKANSVMHRLPTHCNVLEVFSMLFE